MIGENLKRSNELIGKTNSGEKKETIQGVIIKTFALVILIGSIVISGIPYIIPYLLKLLLGDISIVSEDILYKVTIINIVILLFFAIVLYCIGTIKDFAE